MTRPELVVYPHIFLIITSGWVSLASFWLYKWRDGGSERLGTIPWVTEPRLTQEGASLQDLWPLRAFTDAEVDILLIKKFRELFPHMEYEPIKCRMVLPLASYHQPGHSAAGAASPLTNQYLCARAGVGKSRRATGSGERGSGQPRWRRLVLGRGNGQTSFWHSPFPWDWLNCFVYSIKTNKKIEYDPWSWFLTC